MSQRVACSPLKTDVITTNNAVATAMLNYATTNNSVLTGVVVVSARNTATNKTASTIVGFAAQNIGGTLTVLGTPNILLTIANGSDAAMAAVLAALGTDGGAGLVVNVTGIAATGIEWMVTLLGQVN